MNSLVDVFKFILFLGFAVFIPGYVFIRQLKIDNLLFRIFLSLGLGLILLTLAAYLNRLAPYGLIAASLYFFVKGFTFSEFKTKAGLKLSYPQLITILVILLGIVFQSLAAFKSGRVYDFGIGYWGPLGHDGVWHQALVEQLVKKVPPDNPGLSGTSLTNYHYFYDLLVAETVRLTDITSADLIFRFYPILFSTLVGAGTYLLTKLLFRGWRVGVFSLFLVYFGGSFGFIVEWLRGRTLGGESAFWANQPVSMNLNPPFAISLVLVIAAVLAFYVFGQKRNFWSGFVLAVISGVLIGFKVYAGLIVLFSLGTVSVIKIIFNKDYSYLKVFTASLSVSLLVFLPSNTKSAGLIVFSPFWLVHSMVDFADRVGWVRLSQARQAYFSGGNWPKFILAEVLAFGIFVAGNMGTRIVGLFGFPGLVKKKFWKDGTMVFILLMSLASFLPAILFIQKGNSWNTIQFIYYFLYFGALLGGLGLTVLVKVLPRFLGILIVGLILFITPVSSFSTFRSGFYGAPSRLTLGEAGALAFLKTQPEGFVLTHPFNKELRSSYSSPYPLPVYETSAYVSAFSQKETYIEDQFQQEIFQNDYQTRLNDSSKFFYNKDFVWSRNFLLDNKISYIYLPKLYGIGLDEKALRLDKIFSNKEADIYKVRQ